MGPTEPLRKVANRLSATQGAATGGAFGADGGESARGCPGEGEEFLHDAEDEARAIDDGKFAVKAIDVGVDGVWRDAKVGGDGGFGAVVENAADDLEFARG